jgi:hypothetical protein
MYGDPRGYKFNGPPQWYQFEPNMHGPRITEIYLWSMDRKDLERVENEPWIDYLEGKDPQYPVKALRKELETVRRKVELMRTDPTTADTRLADYLLDLNPAATDALCNLTLGGYFAGRIWTLHSRFRYFDPERRRAGLPEDVGALVEKMSATSATLTLVNVNPVEPREVIVQAGGYGEHTVTEAEASGRTLAVNASLLRVKLEPGCGARIELKMSRYANTPTLRMPWDLAQ